MQNIKEANIYNKLRELTMHIELSVRKFNRRDKYVIGSELRQLTSDLLCELSFFNDKSDKEKLEFLQKDMKKVLEKLDFKIAFCKEIKSFSSFDSWYKAAELLTEIINQTNYLIKHFKRGSTDSHK